MPAAKVRSLNNFRAIRLIVTGWRRAWLQWRHGVSIHPEASLSLSATMIGGAPGAIEVGEGSLVAFKTMLVARTPDGEIKPIVIGRNCFIGGGSVIAPGVHVADGSIVGAGAVVFEDVPPRCAVGGNPARVLRENLDTGRFGRLASAADNSRRLYRPDRA